MYQSPIYFVSQARFYADLRSRIINFQRFARGYLTRKAYQKQKDAVVTIQAGVRMYIAKKEIRRLREERARWTFLNVWHYFHILQYLF